MKYEICCLCKRKTPIYHLYSSNKREIKAKCCSCAYNDLDDQEKELYDELFKSSPQDPFDLVENETREENPSEGEWEKIKPSKHSESSSDNAEQ